jgi:hypothetical protein
MPAIGCQRFNTRHSPGSGIVAKGVDGNPLGDAGAQGGFTAGQL